MPQPVMSELRASTAQEHQDLEEEVAIVERLRTHSGYRELLCAFYGFVRPFEERLAGFDWSQLGIDFEERRKARLLEKDLEALDIAPGDVRSAAVLPELSNFAEACGALYVMEGSTLGGQHIAKMAGQAQVTPEVMHYFQSYRERVPEMWKSLGSALNQYAEETEQRSSVVAGARKTFRAFQDWFHRCREAK